MCVIARPDPDFPDFQDASGAIYKTSRAADRCADRAHPSNNGIFIKQKGIDNSAGPAILLGPEKKGGLNFLYRSRAASRGHPKTKENSALLRIKLNGHFRAYLRSLP
jgi:hypothetical protein